MTKPLMRSFHRLWDLPEWMQEGTCVFEGDPDWWFPEKGGPVAILESRQAVRICDRCPVRTECLTYADEHHERGIWGGLTEQQRTLRRRNIRRRHSDTERLHLCSLSSSS